MQGITLTSHSSRSYAIFRVIRQSKKTITPDSPSFEFKLKDVFPPQVGFPNIGDLSLYQTYWCPASNPVENGVEEEEEEEEEKKEETLPKILHLALIYLYAKNPKLQIFTL
ncbi:hypothetical protein DUI87_17654 [Hirundo rustica rustica]|uniref:Uncharacterized protein n=1 Tax=Hirundo rustica rustica TaxID=333673 RepID=A0A3M0JYX2_HIRRU|nr:hypothetical protein DUI87_17654 [Hirundo rustica rustica]